MQYSSDLHVIMLTSIVESNCLTDLRPNPKGNKQTLTLTAGPEGLGEVVDERKLVIVEIFAVVVVIVVVVSSL